MRKFIHLQFIPIFQLVSINTWFKKKKNQRNLLLVKLDVPDSGQAAH